MGPVPWTGISGLRHRVREARQPGFTSWILGMLLTGSVAVNAGSGPALKPLSVTTPEDSPAAIERPALGAAGKLLSYQLIQKPQHGTVVDSGNLWSYQPSLNYNGSDSFIYAVTDGEGDFRVGSVAISVTPVNDPPVAKAQTVVTVEEVPVLIRLEGEDVEAEPLAFELVSQPTQGVIVRKEGASAAGYSDWIYTPRTNAYGIDRLTFKVRTAEGVSSSSATVVIQIDPVNDAPVAKDQKLTTAEDTALPIVLTAIDPDGNPLRYTLTTPPTMGTLAGTPPNLLYRPFPNASGTDAFRFRVNDGSIDSDEGVVEITVTPVNDPPVAASLVVTTLEDMPVSFRISASDVEGSRLGYIPVKGPEKGELKGLLPYFEGQVLDLIYVPKTNANGVDTITFMATDGFANSAEAEVSIRITPVNDAPLVASQSVSTAEDVALVLRLGASDPDGDRLSYRITRPPAHGELLGSGTNLTYRPATNWSGLDSFRFVADDGTIESPVGTVSIEVTRVNDLPTADPLKVGLDEDQSVPILLSGSDAESVELSFRVTVPPSRGVLTGTPPRLIYTPNRDVSGADSFSYRVNDGTDDSAEAVVSLQIEPVNDAPIALVQTASTEEDTPLALTLQGVDVDGDPLTFAITDPPTLGTLSGSPPNLVYTPSPNVFGVDRFRFQAGDGRLDSRRATVVVAVNPVNDAPVVKVPSSPVVVEASGPAGSDVVFDVSATDTEDGAVKVVVSRASGGRFPLGYSEVFASATDSGGLVGTASFMVSVVDTTAPRIVVPSDITAKAGGPHGAVVEYAPLSATDAVTSSPLIRVTPPSGSLLPMGRTEVLVVATDDAGNEGQARFVVTVLNQRPSARDAMLTAVEDVPIAVRLAGSDPEGAVLEYTITSGPKLGTLGGTPPNLLYTPSTNVHGVDRFRFRVGDGNLDSEEAEITLVILPVNDAPVALAQAIGTLEDTAVAITLSGSNAEEDPLTYRVTEAPRQGRLSGTPPNLVYTPDQNVNGVDRFRFRVADGDLDSEEAEVTVTITPVNDIPIARAQTLNVTEDNPREVFLSGVDPEGAPLTFSVVTPPTLGKLSGSGAAWTYQPNTNAFGTDSFTYRVSDGETNSVEALVTLLILPVNDAPESRDQEVTLPEDTSKAVTLVAKDVEGDALEYTITAPPAFGVLTGTPPNLTYQPMTNFAGADRFRFKARDGAADSAEAVVSITVTPVNDVPVAQVTSVETAEETAVRISLKGTDVEGSPLTFAVVTPPRKGVLSGVAPDLVYLPNTNATGTDTFTFKVNDGAADSAAAVVTVDITPVNDAPVAFPQSISTAEDVPKAFTLSATDPDGDRLGFLVTEAPSHGTLSGTAPNLTYRPQTNWSGLDQFRFKATDAVSESPELLVQISVAPVNDAPFAQSQTASLKEDTSVEITLVASDAEGSPLKYILSSLPTKGLLSGTPPRLVYTPDEDANGIDTFTYRVNDGSLDSVQATVTLNITGVNDAPVALAQAVTVTEDVRKPIVLKASDVDGDRLQYTVTVPPSLGTLVGTPPNLVYVPKTNAFGSDRFLFRAQDASISSPEAEVTITIEPVNDAPVILESKVRQVTSGGFLTFQIPAVDPEVPQEQKLTFERGQGPEGFLVSREGLVSWRPSSAQGPGNYWAEIRVTDSGTPAKSVTKVLQVQVVAKNEPPTPAVPVDRTVPAGTQFTLALTASDPDLPSQPLRFRLLSGPAGMTVSTNGQLSWKAPAATKPAIPQTIKFEVSDGTAAVSGSFRLTVAESAAVLPVAVLSGASRSNLVLSVYGVSGVTYALESRQDLGQAWSAVPGIPAIKGAGMDKPVSVSLPVDATGSGFYRVRRP